MAKKEWSLPFRRMFGDWTYTFDEGFMSKSDAKKKAEALRKRGLLARVVPATDGLGRKGYAVYWKRVSY